MEGVRGISLVYVVRKDIKVAQFHLEMAAFLNLDGMIVRVSIVDASLDLYSSQEYFKKKYLQH